MDVCKLHLTHLYHVGSNSLNINYVCKMQIFFLYFLLYILHITHCSQRRRSRSSGIHNMPMSLETEDRSELAYPYLNVYYNFDPKDWNHIVDDQEKLINLRKRLSLIRRQLSLDTNRIQNFMSKQRNVMINSKANLFRRAIHKNVVPNENKTINNLNVTENGNIEEIEPSYVKTYGPYYYQLLASQLN